MPDRSRCILGKGVKIFQPELVNLYGCTIGAKRKWALLWRFKRTLQLVLVARFRRTLLFVKA